MNPYLYAGLVVAVAAAMIVALFLLTRQHPRIRYSALTTGGVYFLVDSAINGASWWFWVISVASTAFFAWILTEVCLASGEDEAAE